MNGVVVSFSGGLGNQLFQYAAGLELSERMSLPLWAETEFYKYSPNRSFVLNKLNLEFKKLRGFALYKALQVQNYYWGDLFRKNKRLKRSPLLFEEQHFEYDSRFEKLNAPVYLYGYWQSERYFPNVSSKLRQQIQQPVSGSLKSLLNEIDVNAVCVHIRRGDYTRNPEIARIHGVCDAEYYCRAIEAIKLRIASPRFFIFTDEPSASFFIKEIVAQPVMVNELSGGDELVEFALMQQFHNFIIANSTFSWWAAWSSLRENKKVVCPQNWFADKSKNTADLYPSNWIKC